MAAVANHRTVVVNTVGVVASSNTVRMAVGGKKSTVRGQGVGVKEPQGDEVEELQGEGVGVLTEASVCVAHLTNVTVVA